MRIRLKERHLSNESMCSDVCYHPHQLTPDIHGIGSISEPASMDVHHDSSILRLLCIVQGAFMYIDVQVQAILLAKDCSLVVKVHL